MSFEKPEDCPVCFEEMGEEKSLECGHWVHVDCVKKSGKAQCPICRAKLNIEIESKHVFDFPFGRVTIIRGGANMPFIDEMRMFMAMTYLAMMENSMNDDDRDSENEVDENELPPLVDSDDELPPLVDSDDEEARLMNPQDSGIIALQRAIDLQNSFVNGGPEATINNVE